MKKINEIIDQNISKIIIVFLFSMPFLDLITSLILNVAKLQFNLVIILKMIIMLLFIYYLFFISKSKYKKISVIYILLIFIYCSTYIFVVFQNKPSSFLIYELNNFIRTFYFPVNLICLFNIYKERKINIENKHISIILVTYILLLFVPIITNIDFNSYAYSKEGSIGWFNSTNEIGAILSILLPISLYNLFKTRKIQLIIPIILIGLYTYFSLGTKVPILSIVIILFILLIRYVYQIIKLKKYKKIAIVLASLIIIISLGIILIPKTSFYKNIIIHLEFLEVDEISDLTDTRIIDKFVFSDRISYYVKTKNNYVDSSIDEKLLGIGYIEKYSTDETNIKTIEMDYYDIFFRHGIIGFILFFIPYVYILISLFAKLKNIIKVDNELISLLISIILILVLSLFSGHILVAPSVSIFVIMILLMTSKKLEVI